MPCLTQHGEQGPPPQRASHEHALIHTNVCAHSMHTHIETESVRKKLRDRTEKEKKTFKKIRKMPQE